MIICPVPRIMFAMDHCQNPDAKQCDVDPVNLLFLLVLLLLLLVICLSYTQSLHIQVHPWAGYRLALSPRTQPCRGCGGLYTTSCFLTGSPNRQPLPNKLSGQGYRDRKQSVSSSSPIRSRKETPADALGAEWAFHCAQLGMDVKELRSPAGEILGHRWCQ